MTMADPDTSLFPVFNSFPGMVGVVDFQANKVIWRNEAWRKRLASFTGKECLITEALAQFIHPADMEFVMTSLATVAKREEPSKVILVRHRPGSSESNWQLFQLNRMEPHANGAQLVCCIQIDLSDFSDVERLCDFYHDFRKKRQWPPMASLTQRELEVLGCIARGFSYTTIADQLYIQPETVNKHRKNIQKKLNLHSIAMLTCFAVEHGLVKPDKIQWSILLDVTD